MKKKNWLIGLFFVISICLSCFTITACDSNQPGASTKQVPIYQGMSVSKTKPERANQLMAYHVSKNSDDNNGNHYGHYKGDYEGKDKEFDKENPFPDGTQNGIEDEIDNTLVVEGAKHTIYYANQYEDVYIYIHIDNPDNFEILSFTLNNKKFSSYMFEEGSDMETLILKYNVGEDSGFVDYTIDAIKYVDNSQIKDVKMDGDKTVKVGIQKDDQLLTTISNVTFGIHEFSLDIEIQDDDGLIQHSEGQINSVLYDGETIVETKKLNVGTNHVHFQDLQANTLYQYALVGHYDNLDGSGFGVKILQKDAFYTEAIVLFDDIVIGKEEISFNLSWHESLLDNPLTTLTLYQDNSLVASLDAATLSVNELLSGCDYTLKAEFDYLNRTETISLDFTTLKKQVPHIEIVEVENKASSISFDIIKTDTDNICEIVKIEVLDESGSSTILNDVSTRIIENLVSGEYYTIRVYIAYDLNDGNGTQEKCTELTTKTIGLSPIQVGAFTIINEFGFYYNQTLNNYIQHDGIDFGAKVDSNVYSVFAGVVERIDESDLLNGTQITIDHGNGLKTIYRYVDVAEGVKVGDTVKAKQLIATVAEATGAEYREGPHLHFEIHENGQAIDPMKFLVFDDSSDS